MDWFDVFTEAGAVWRWTGQGPHAAYRLSAHHSGFYLNTDVLVADPAGVSRLVRDGLLPHAGDAEWILTPVTSIAAGLVLAAELARQLGARLAYFDPRERAWSVTPPAGARALTCLDDVHGGGSLRAITASALNLGVTVTRAVTLANFSGRDVIDGVAVHALVTPRIGVWPAARCPLCAAGSPAVDARARWRDLGCGASGTK